MCQHGRKQQRLCEFELPHRTPSRVGKAMPRSASVVSHSRVTALLCLAVPAEAGCSKYNASWCLKYSILDATTPQVQAVMLKRFGDTAVPRTIIGGVLVEGVDEARIRQLCR
jgi:hypothetical protein